MEQHIFLKNICKYAITELYTMHVFNCILHSVAEILLAECEHDFQLTGAVLSLLFLNSEEGKHSLP